MQYVTELNFVGSSFFFFVRVLGVLLTSLKVIFPEAEEDTKDKSVRHYFDFSRLKKSLHIVAATLKHIAYEHTQPKPAEADAVRCTHASCAETASRSARPHCDMCTEHHPTSAPHHHVNTWPPPGAKIFEDLPDLKGRVDSSGIFTPSTFQLTDGVVLLAEELDKHFSKAAQFQLFAKLADAKDNCGKINGLLHAPEPLEVRVKMRERQPVLILGVESNCTIAGLKSIIHRRQCELGHPAVPPSRQRIVFAGRFQDQLREVFPDPQLGVLGHDDKTLAQCGIHNGAEVLLEEELSQKEGGGPATATTGSAGAPGMPAAAAAEWMASFFSSALFLISTLPRLVSDADGLSRVALAACERVGDGLCVSSACAGVVGGLVLLFNAALLAFLYPCWGTSGLCPLALAMAIALAPAAAAAAFSHALSALRANFKTAHKPLPWLLAEPLVGDYRVAASAGLLAGLGVGYPLAAGVLCKLPVAGQGGALLALAALGWRSAAWGGGEVSQLADPSLAALGRVFADLRRDYSGGGGRKERAAAVSSGGASGGGDGGSSGGGGGARAVPVEEEVLEVLPLLGGAAIKRKA